MSDNVEETGTPIADPGPSSRTLAAARWRDLAARVIWGVCVTLALILAAAAFTFALEANANNDLVKIVRDLANAFDLGFFDLDNPVKEFTGKNDLVKTALFNYGIAAVVYLVVGRLLERVIRP
ncbi:MULTISPECIES: hypothetical protein [unclassified Nocardioides]|uniref:hypothetical protein n=1 Tax=unclassified Nocardioides TaxID=2615069 RepID=UPI0006FF82DE|nr:MULTISPECIES: hypothetical protein [unclassified Nocardioides]KRA29489.1 hypothetical protein ASD81_21155 [Nocardioides sp. Root614]KRA88336.1 hypothetical protein ASD84_20460 [Nocardioides sp. Root682]